MFWLARELKNEVDRELSPHGITSSQAALILFARTRARLTIGSAARLLGTDTAAVTRLVDRLESKGLVRREAAGHDRRAVTISVTETGEALAPSLLAAFQAVHHRVAAALEPGEEGILEAIVSRLLGRLAGGVTA